MSNPSSPDGDWNGRKNDTIIEQAGDKKDGTVEEEGHDDAKGQGADATPSPTLPIEGEKVDLAATYALDVQLDMDCPAGPSNNVPATPTTTTIIEKVLKTQKNAMDESCTTSTTSPSSPIKKTPPPETAFPGLIKGAESTFDLTDFSTAGYCVKMPESTPPGLPLPPQRSGTPLFSPSPRRTVLNSPSAPRSSRSVSPLTPSTDQRSLTSSPIRFTPDSRTLGYTTPPIFPPRSRFSPGHAIPPIVLKANRMDAEPLLSTAYDESTGQISSLLDVLENLDEPVSLLLLLKEGNEEEEKEKQLQQQEQQQQQIEIEMGDLPTVTATTTATATTTTTATATTTTTVTATTTAATFAAATNIAAPLPPPPTNTATMTATITKKRIKGIKKPLQKSAGTQLRSTIGNAKRKLEPDAPAIISIPIKEKCAPTTSPEHIDGADAGIIPMDIDSNEELDLAVDDDDDNTSRHDKIIVKSKSPSVEASSSSKKAPPLNEEKEQKDLSQQQQQQQQQRRQVHAKNKSIAESINNKTKTKRDNKSQEESPQEESSCQLRSGSQSKVSSSSSKQSKSKKIPSSSPPLPPLPHSPLPPDKENGHPDQDKGTRRYLTRNRKPRLVLCNTASPSASGSSKLNVQPAAAIAGPSSSRPAIIIDDDERANDDVDEDTGGENTDVDDGYEWDPKALQKYARSRPAAQKALDRELAEVCKPGDAINKRKRRAVKKTLVPLKPNTMGRRKNKPWRCPTCLKENKVVWLTSTKAHARHKLKEHKDFGDFKCEQCNPVKLFKAKDDLRHHERSVHISPDKKDFFLCLVCKTPYGRRADYNKHFKIKNCSREKPMVRIFGEEKTWMFEQASPTGSKSADYNGGIYTRVNVLPKRLQEKTPEERAREKEEAKKKACAKPKKIPYAQLCQFDKETPKTVRKKSSLSSSSSSSKKPTEKSKNVIGKKTTSTPKPDHPIVQSKTPSRRRRRRHPHGDGTDDATVDECELEEKQEQQSVATKSPSTTLQKNKKKKRELILNKLKIQPRRSKKNQKEQDSVDNSENEKEEETEENGKKPSLQTQKKDKGKKKVIN